MDSSNRKPRILYIEDDLTLSNLYSMRMVAEGFEVKAVNQGEEALQVAREFHPDLILCDIMMPNISGYDVIDILKNTLETSNAKIVVISALSQPEDIQKAKDLGVDDYIVKSEVVIDDIMNRLRTLLQLPPSTLSAH